MPSSYISVNGKAKKVTKAYIGVNGVAKEVKSVYFGASGLAKQVFSSGLSTQVVRLTKSAYAYFAHTENNLLFADTNKCIFGVNKKFVNFDCGYLSNNRISSVDVASFSGCAFFAAGYDQDNKWHKEIEYFSGLLVRNDSLSLQTNNIPKSAIINDKYLVYAEGKDSDGYARFSVITKDLVKTSAIYQTGANYATKSATSYKKSGYFLIGAGELYELTENLQYQFTGVHLSEYDRLASNEDVIVAFSTSGGSIRSINSEHVVQLIYKNIYSNTKALHGSVSTNKFAIFSYKFSTENYICFVDKLSMAKLVTGLRLRSAWTYPIMSYKNCIVTSEDVIGQHISMACTLIAQDYFDENNEPLKGQ